MHYDLVKNYAMKCRLYPNKAQKQAIDNAITAVRVFHNCLVYDMWNNGRNLREWHPKDTEDESTEMVRHYPDLDKALSAAYKNELKKSHPIIKACPQNALTTDSGLKSDLKKEFADHYIEKDAPVYYNETHPRNSYSYDEYFTKISFIQPTDDSQPNVFHIKLASLKIPAVKVRGWNKKLRFGDENTDFLTWATQTAKTNPKERITVIVSRDAVGDYYIVFKIKECLKPFAPATDAKIGIDVGIKDLVITSDGTKYENKKFKKQKKRHQRRLNRMMSRRWGPSNEVYREARKKNRALIRAAANDPSGQPPPELIRPSKGYLKAKQRHARLNRKITRRREAWNHEISRRIVEQNCLIGMETLNICAMVRNRHLSGAIHDAAFGSLHSYAKYKSEWHGRTFVQIDQWTPSSKRCSNCSYIYSSKDQYHLKPWSLTIRDWVCPVCGTRHDRDINAAKNILFFAEELTTA